jgi:hypothetical protein
VKRTLEPLRNLNDTNTQKGFAMKYQLSLLMAVPLTLALAGDAGAQHRGGGYRGASRGSPKGNGYKSTGFRSTSTGHNFAMGSHRPTTTRYSNYHLRYGTRFSHGYYYRGRNHSHWSHRYWNRRYGCWTYWDPCCSCYYYWCVPANCFYPVSYCPYSRYCWSDSNYCVESVPVVQTPQSV